MTTLTDWLDAAAARVDAATDGPWASRDSVDGFSSWVHGPRGCVAAARSTPSRELGVELGPLQSGRRREDAEFIAAARTDLPAAITALRAVLRIHAPSTDHLARTDAYCVGCYEAGGEDGMTLWPCATVRAISEAIGEAP